MNPDLFEQLFRLGGHVGGGQAVCLEQLIRLAGRHDNLFTRIVSWPGLKIQRLTTREPDDGMIEAAIASIEAVLPEDLKDAVWGE